MKRKNRICPSIRLGRVGFYPLLLMGLVFTLISGCKKEASINPALPVVTTSAVSAITANAATCGGNITSDGGSAVIARGVCWSIGKTPTIADNKTTDGAGAGIFTSALSGLSVKTSYFIRAYATNSVGTGYGSSMSFTTNDQPIPILTTSSVSNITQTEATSGGNIISDGGSAVIARGVCWSIDTTPTIANNKTTDGTGAGIFTSALTGLSVNTSYYIRAYATNIGGTGYGSSLSFTTKTSQIPVLTTTSLSNITQTTATSSGNITSDGGAMITDRGTCWSTTPNPTIANYKTSDGTGIGSFSSNITGLTSNTTYYLRAFATNSSGTGYGNEMSFYTRGTFGTLTDPRDGKIYKTITIGTQMWMTENLQWEPSVYAADWKEYNNMPSLGLVYGTLYNYSLSTKAALGISGWRVPTDNDWKTVVDYLGGNTLAGAKLKEAADTSPVHWIPPNTGSTNSSGFTALGSGYYDVINALGFQDLNNIAYFWSSTPYTTFMIIYSLQSADSWAKRLYGDKSNYYSIRLVKNI